MTVTRKEYLFQTHSIGKGKGKGRISFEGHALIAAARKTGMTFTDDAPKPVKRKNAFTVTKSASKPKRVREPKEPSETDNLYPAAVRKWAEGKGIAVPARGRISAEVKEAYIADVAVADREEAPDPDASFKATPEPRYALSQEWEGTLPNGKKVRVGNATVCVPCGFSLPWHNCDNPSAVVDSGIVVSLSLVRK